MDSEEKQILKCFYKNMKKDNNIRKALNKPIALYDLDKKEAYMAYSDGTIISSNNHK